MAKNPISRYTDAGHMASWLRHALQTATTEVGDVPPASGAATTAPSHKALKTRRAPYEAL